MWGGIICPWFSGAGTQNWDLVVTVGVKVFLLTWIIFVPIVITARLEKIIKILQEKK